MFNSGRGYYPYNRSFLFAVSISLYQPICLRMLGYDDLDRSAIFMFCSRVRGCLDCVFIPLQEREHVSSAVFDSEL